MSGKCETIYLSSCREQVEGGHKMAVYWADIIKCENQLFATTDSLIKWATEAPFNFITGADKSDVVSVELNDSGLEIIMRELDNYDETTGEEIYKNVSDTFEYEYLEYAV
jgi:hypothetical protein